MIAGDHLHPDPRAAAFGDGGNRLWARWIDQAEEAQKGQPALQRGSVEPVPHFSPLGQRQHPEAPPRTCLGRVGSAT